MMEKVRLGDLCVFQSGGTPSKSNSEYFNGDIPWITTVALNGDTIGQESAVDWITSKAIEKSSARIVPANSVMVGTRVGVGKVAINSISMSTSQDIISLLEIDESRWDKDFICKFIISKNAHLNSQARGATIKGIKIEILANLELPLISLSEQKKISFHLNKITDLINKRKQQLSKLDELIKARFVELFGDPVVNPKSWETAPLFALIINANNGMARRGKDADGSIVLRLVELQNGFIDYSAPNRICLNETEKKRYELVDNDFLFARVNG
ncbi:MAG: restriction endonuclease subunit S, partial [Oscillospiraceae bacterium]|nr:restriction endonuclease subunit S [Oscillospiraceae bacterium]